MKAPMILDEVEQQLCSFAESHQEIAALFLFGSILTRDTPEDIDIALLVYEEKVEKADYPLYYRARATIKVANLLRHDSIDLMLMNISSPIICMQVLRKGKKIFVRDERKVNQFIVSTFNNYHDLKIVRRPIEHRILEGLIYG
ncbi:MAG: nucleotidyltransferase domain-containing protein [bacterium]